MLFDLFIFFTENIYAIFSIYVEMVGSVSIVCATKSEIYELIENYSTCDDYYFFQV